MQRRSALILLCMPIVIAGCSGQPPATSSAPDAPPASQRESLPAASTSAGPIGQASAPPSASAAPTEPSPPPISWSEAGSFSNLGLTIVTDLSAWDGGFIAVGQSWSGGYITVGTPTVWVWTSVDGRSWQQLQPDLGTEDVEPHGVLRTADGRVAIVASVGRLSSAEGGRPPRAAAWVSSDGLVWEDVAVPFGEVSAIGSGPVGHVAATPSELWYSADGLAWQRAYRAAEGVNLGRPVGGDEGFVVTAVDLESEDRSAMVLASGDGLAWYEAEPPTPLGSVAPWRGDWLAPGYTANPPISIFRSANGLDWAPVLDVNDLTPPDGPKARGGMETEINETTLVGEGGWVALTLGWNHCCAVPAVGVDVFTSTDAVSWTDAGLPGGAYVTAVATDGDAVVLAGYVDRGATAKFWVSDR